MAAIKDLNQHEQPVIDLELGAKILGATIEKAKEMVGELVSLLPEDLKKIQAAYADNNHNALQNLAHYVKGGASYCGTPRLKLAASRLEESLQQQHSRHEIKPAYDQLCWEISAVIDEYQHQN